MQKRGSALLIALVAAAGLAVGGMALLEVVKVHSDNHFYDDYDPKAPLHATIRGEETRPAYRRLDFTFEGMPGIPVPTLMAMPIKGRPPFPALIFLHGIGQSKGFLDRIAEPFVKEGYVILCFDQYMQGEREINRANPFEMALAFRRRAALTVNETRRLVDYLESRPDIDKDRIFLLGASYGAITGSTAAAFDKRFKAALLCYGGGDPAKLVDSVVVRNVAGPIGVIPIKAVAKWYLGVSDPCNYVAQISPRPVFFQNGKNDTVVPPSSSEALIAAAKEPKDVIWYDSDHVGLDENHVARVLNDALAWLKAHDPGVTKDTRGKK